MNEINPKLDLANESVRNDMFAIFNSMYNTWSSKKISKIYSEVFQEKDFTINNDTEFSMGKGIKRKSFRIDMSFFDELIQLDPQKISEIRSNFVEEEKKEKLSFVEIIFWAILVYGGGYYFLRDFDDATFAFYFYSLTAGYVFIIISLATQNFFDNRRVRKENEARQKIFEAVVLREDKQIKLKKSTNTFIDQLDEDGNGIVDVIEGDDFKKLVRENQEKIAQIDVNHVQKFVKISTWLETKKGNIQRIFDRVKNLVEQKNINEKTQNFYVESLKTEIHTYEQVLFNSLSMLVALIEKDLVTFEEIYEVFDNLNMFDRKFERDMSSKLSNIELGLNNLVQEINRSNNKIIESIQTLTAVTKESSERMENHLKSIGSSLKTANIINSINAYQNYKQNNQSNQIKQI